MLWLHGDVNATELPSRFRMALAQIGRGSIQIQWPATNWLAVLRRALVLAAIFGWGVTTGNLATAVFASFGALQMGLIEAALPFGRLLRLLLVNVIVLTAVAYVAASLGGTWWTVVLLGGIAFVHGTMTNSGLLPMATSMGAMLIGVIFAGLPDAPAMAATAARCFLVGAVIQSTVWLITWRAERTRSVRRLLANSIRSVQQLLPGDGIDMWRSQGASLDSERVKAALAASGVAPAQLIAANNVLSATAHLHRCIVAWRVLKQPGWADRLRATEALRRTIERLDESMHRAPEPIMFVATDPWPIDEAVSRAIAGLDDSVNCFLRALDSGGKPDATDRAHPQHDQAKPTGDMAAMWKALTPGNPLLRHGVRLAAAIMIAQCTALLVEIGHSFWIPLTVALIVKPDWSFTVIRSATRLVGNLAAVVLVPLALSAAVGVPWAITFLVFALGATAFRYFTGNYIAASFGVAGTILILDETLSPDGALYLWRIVATLIGTLIGVAVALAVPTWSSRGANTLLGNVVTDLAAWCRGVCTGLGKPKCATPEAMIPPGHTIRDELAILLPQARAALLEPRPATDPRMLTAAAEASQRLHLILTALSFHALLLHEHASPGVDVSRPSSQAVAALDRSAERLGGDPSPTWSPPQSASQPTTAEATAVAAQAAHLAVTADALLAAVESAQTG